jgi:hypothetical protein
MCDFVFLMLSEASTASKYTSWECFVVLSLCFVMQRGETNVRRYGS